MKKASRYIPLKDVSIAKKLYFIVGAMAILIVLELFTLWFSIHTLSSVRALIGAEGLWSKAQKDASYYLVKYHRTHKEEDYQAFRSFMAVPLGDHKARVELFKQDPNLQIIRQGFLEGRIHEDDISGVIRLLRRFNRISYVGKAIDCWGQGDSLIAYLIPIGNAMKAEMASGSPSQDKLDELTLEVDRLNIDLTKVEDEFSFTLEEGSRWLENLVLKILFSVALTVEITGLIFTILVTRNITKGLKEINSAVDKIAKGHLKERATVFSNDEIGQTATSVNRMADQLIVSNQELENFAHVASHDLQEPLRKIIIYTGLLQQEISETISEKGRQNMDRVVRSAAGMRRMIEGVLEFASVTNSAMEFVPVNLNKKVANVISNMEISIAKTDAKITVADLPIIEGNSVQMEQLFQNLVSNALKFSKENPVIDISVEIITKEQLPDDYWLNILDKFAHVKKVNDTEEKYCRIYVKDNGIGFEDIYLDKVFAAFQRLHGKHLYKGTGIGLAICKKIVENHHGIIFAKSILGEGSTFIIILPLTQNSFKNT